MLGLFDYDPGTSRWLDAITTCPGAEYLHDMDANWLSLPLCHLTEFGLFTNPIRTFLPLARR
jgi:hypothetical protein